MGRNKVILFKVVFASGFSVGIYGTDKKDVLAFCELLYMGEHGEVTRIVDTTGFSCDSCEVHHV